MNLLHASKMAYNMKVFRAVSLDIKGFFISKDSVNQCPRSAEGKNACDIRITCVITSEKKQAGVERGQDCFCGEVNAYIL